MPSRNDDLTPEEERYREKLETLSAERAAAVKREREITLEIATLAVDARRDQIRMRMLAQWIKVADKEGELRPVTRQAVDNMIAAHEGRDRQHRRPRPRRSSGGVNSAAFG